MRVLMGKRLHRDESGLASIVIAILIIIVLSTMVLGFLQIIRRESRRSLDRQLSTQAYYAAESGVNDAVKAIQQQDFTGNKSNCDPLVSNPTNPAAISGMTNQLSGNDVKYSCLLINQTPGDLEYSNVTTNHAKAFPVYSGGSIISTLAFGWENNKVDVGTAVYRFFAPSGDKDFLSAFNWSSTTGILRVDILPFTSSTMTRDAAITATHSYFLYPSIPGAAAISYTTDASGTIRGGNCKIVGGLTSRQCNVTVMGLPATTQKVFVRILALYNPIDVTVKAYGVSAPTLLTPSLPLDGAQTVVDSTGKAADVYRRIQVRVPPADVYIPDYALASMDTLCKKFFVNPTSVYAVADGGVDPGACNPTNW